MRNNAFQMPVKVGDEINVRIEAVGEKGDGICKKRGFVLFVPNTREGDEVKIRVTKVLTKVGFAESIGEADGPIEGEMQQQQRARQEPQEVNLPEPEPAPEDSEDFGEELLEEDAEVAPEDMEIPDAPEGEAAEPVVEYDGAEEAEEEKKEE